jgi:hypothetical protein
MGHERAKAEILRDLASSNGEKRRAAIVASGRARLVEAKPMLESRLPAAETDGTGDGTFLSEALAALAT